MCWCYTGFPPLPAAAVIVWSYTPPPPPPPVFLCVPGSSFTDGGGGGGGSTAWSMTTIKTSTLQIVQYSLPPTIWSWANCSSDVFSGVHLRDPGLGDRGQDLLHSRHSSHAGIAFFLYFHHQACRQLYCNKSACNEPYLSIFEYVK